jgi:hypothetical protein
MPTKKGGKMKASEIKDFLIASYDETPPKDLDGYILDSSLSSATAKVYYNPQTGHAVVAHRGTQGVWDWGNNIAYALGYYNYTPRYKTGKFTQDKAEKKYGKQNISTLGHSQGAVLARKLGADTKEVINVNPAYAFEKPKKNEYNIRSSTDVVSGLYAPVAKTRQGLFPNYSKKHDITIPSQSATDVLGEHSYNILDRMGDAEIGVGAGNKISSNNIMKCGGRRTNKLGFTADDIDWFGGSQGTAYINRGTNPYGTRGAGRYEESDSDDDYSDEEIEGGRRRKNPLASIGRTMAHAINPMSYVLESKKGKQAGIGLGDATNNYILPATVSAGKPIYDATAMTASTMLTGNPVLGKVAADTLWDKMVADKGFDPRERQKSQELGELSSTLGQAVAKPYSASLGGILSRNLVAEEFKRRDRQRRIGGSSAVSKIARLKRLLQTLRDELSQTRNANRREELMEQINQVRDELASEVIKIEVDNYRSDISGSDTSDNEGSVSDTSEDNSVDFLEDTKDDDEEEKNGRGLRRKGVNFEKVKWGTFTRMFKEFKKEHPRSRVKDLGQFANYVIKNKKKFSDKALKKAHFYKNIIMKGS